MVALTSPGDQCPLLESRPKGPRPAPAVRVYSEQHPHCTVVSVCLPLSLGTACSFQVGALSHLSLCRPNLCLVGIGLSESGKEHQVSEGVGGEAEETLPTESRDSCW